MAVIPVENFYVDFRLLVAFLLDLLSQILENHNRDFYDLLLIQSLSTCMSIWILVND